MLQPRDDPGLSCAVIVPDEGQGRLTTDAAAAKTARMAHRFTPLAAVLALSLLAGCNSQPDTVSAGPADPDAVALANAPKIELPPAVKASTVYRCADSSIVYVDFFADDLGANFRTESAGTNTRLTAPAVGEAFVADGYSVSGNGKTVTIAHPGKPAQTCNA